MRSRNRGLEVAAATALALVALAIAHSGKAQDARIEPQKDPSTEVDSLTVRAPLAPVPKVGDGAPQFSSEQLAVVAQQARRDKNYYSEQIAILQGCYIDAYGAAVPPERILGYQEAHTAASRLSAFAQAAQYATQDALAVRRKAAQGEATQAELEASELERQKMVRRVVDGQLEIAEGKAKAIDAQQLSRDKVPVAGWRGVILSKAAERASADADGWNPVPPQFRDLVIEDVKAVSREDPKLGSYVHVTGAIRNTRPKRLSVPPLAVSAIDELGFALSTEVATARGRIEPGAAQPFAYDLKPMPPRATTVAVTFGDPNRSNWLLPATIDPACLPPYPPELDPVRNGGRRGIALPSGRTFLRPSDR